MTEISPKLHSGKASTPDKSLGEAVGLRFWKGTEYLENSTQVPEKSILVFSFSSSEICCRRCLSVLPSKLSKTEIFKDLKITSKSVEAPTPSYLFGYLLKNIFFYFSQDKKSCTN